MNWRTMATVLVVLMAALAAVIVVMLKKPGNGIPVSEDRYRVPGYGVFMANHDARSRDEWRREFDRLGGGG